MMPTADEVLEESRRWVSPWYPPTARHVVSGEYEFYVEGSEATLMTCAGARPGLTSIPGALRAARQSNADWLTVTFGAHPANHRPDIGQAEHVGTIDVLALGLVGFGTTDIPAPASIRVSPVSTLDDFADYERTSAAAWGYPPPSDDSIRAGFETLTPGWFVAYRAGTPIATGGYSLVGAAARLWGAAVIADARGQGAYRRLVAARLSDAADRGATLALTHAAPTSSPILRRLGFRKYGEQLTLRYRTNGEDAVSVMR